MEMRSRGASGDGAEGGGGGGWPLGLRLRILHHTSPLFHSTTSISSHSSSSDLDTESTASFFHDRSTSLGTLMGIRSRPQRSGMGDGGREPELMMQMSQRQQGMAMAKKRGRGEAEMGISRCMFILCCKGRGPSQGELEAEMGCTGEGTMFPSLAHYLEMERKQSTGGGREEGQRHGAAEPRSNRAEEAASECNEGIHVNNNNSTSLFREEQGTMVILPPAPPTQSHLQNLSSPNLMMQKPLAAYLSIDWIPIATRTSTSQQSCP